MIKILKRILMYVLSALFILFLGMQFDHPVRNNSDNQLNHFSTLYPMPDDVSAILSVACYDCHSNNTRYPWYADIQPIGRLLDEHIRNGKKELNFSEFTSYRPRKQFHTMEEVEEMIKESDMPLPSYTKIHRDALLSTEQKELLYAWVRVTKDSMRSIYHPDSLKTRKRK